MLSPLLNGRTNLCKSRVWVSVFHTSAFSSLTQRAAGHLPCELFWCCFSLSHEGSCVLASFWFSFHTWRRGMAAGLLTAVCETLAGACIQWTLTKHLWWTEGPVQALSLIWSLFRLSQHLVSFLLEPCGSYHFYLYRAWHCLSLHLHCKGMIETRQCNATGSSPLYLQTWVPCMMDTWC